MPAQVLGLVQVDFRLQVRKADLAVISMKQLDTLMNNMVVIQSRIIDKGYLVTVRMTLDGVMISINA